MCLQTVRDSGAQCVKSLFRNKKELCSIGLELTTRDATRLTEVCLTNTQQSKHVQSSATFTCNINCVLSDSFCVSAWTM